VIRKYPEEGVIFVRKGQAGKDCNYSGTEFNTDNGEINPRSRPYQPEAFEPSGRGWDFFGLGTKKSSFFFPFGSAPIPS